jgi:serine/threonine protein phosphatase 1
MRTFVMGDIHGAYRALVQCLERSSFDFDNDKLIFLGDVADGWPETSQCVDHLLKIKNLVYIFGNHDFWTLEWMQTSHAEEVWLSQGGAATVKSYSKGIPESHVKLLNESLPYFILEDKFFVHAGFDPKIPLQTQSLSTFLWDRTLAMKALNSLQKGLNEKLTAYEEIFLGHTPVADGKPIKACDIWFMDTGAGWSGVLSMMNLDTYDIFTSDPVPALYPGITGRKKSR